MAPHEFSQLVTSRKGLFERPFGPLLLLQIRPKPVIFGYERGAALAVGGTAPARRLAWFAGTNLAIMFKPDALRLLEADFDWTTGSR